MRIVQGRRAARRHGIGKWDSVIDKTVFPSAQGKKGIDRTNEISGGAMIGVQGVTLSRALTRREIGMNIRAPERINRLLGISHHEHRLLAIAIEGAEDLVLHGIGILKLIKERRRVVSTQPLDQCAGGIRRKRRIQIEQQIIVGLHAPLGLKFPLSGVCP